jgi:hypothetical protein
MTFRPFTVSRNKCWCWFYWCDEEGLLAIQIGPIVLELEHS